MMDPGNTRDGKNLQIRSYNYGKEEEDALKYPAAQAGAALRKEQSMEIHESAEDYLEQILMLLERKGYARSTDIAIGLGVTKPSVSVAMKKLRENGYITMADDGMISLTDKGYPIARRIYDRHKNLTKYLVQLGVPEETAREDACKIEHDLSEESYSAICTQIK